MQYHIYHMPSTNLSLQNSRWSRDRCDTITRSCNRWYCHLVLIDEDSQTPVYRRRWAINNSRSLHGRMCCDDSPRNSVYAVPLVEQKIDAKTDLRRERISFFVGSNHVCRRPISLCALSASVELPRRLELAVTTTLHEHRGLVILGGYPLQELPSSIHLLQVSPKDVLDVTRKGWIMRANLLSEFQRENRTMFCYVWCKHHSDEQSNEYATSFSCKFNIFAKVRPRQVKKICANNLCLSITLHVISA